MPARARSGPSQVKGPLARDAAPRTAVSEASPAEASIVQRATVNATWSLLSEVIPRALILVVSVYLARVLTASNFGLLALAQAYPQFLASSLDLGVSMFGTREVAQDRRRASELFNELLSLRLTVATVAFALYALAVAVIFDGEQRVVFLVSGLFLLAYAGASDWAQRAHERFDLAAVANIAGALVMLSGCILFVRDPSQLLAAAVLWSAAYLVTTALSLLITARALGLVFRPVMRPREWWRHLQSSIFFSLSGLLAFGMYQVNIAVLGASWPTDAVAHFAAPYRLVMAAATTGYFIPLALYPVLATLVAGRGSVASLSATVTRLLLAAGTPIALLGASLAAPILEIVFGPSYTDAAIVFIVLSALIPLQLVIYVLEITLLAHRRERLRTLMNLVALGVAVALAPAIVPQYGSLGAAAVYVTAVAILALALLVAYRRSVGRFLLTVGDVARLLLPAAAMALLLPWGSTSFDVFRALAALVIYFAAALATGLVRPSEVRWLSRSFRLRFV